MRRRLRPAAGPRPLNDYEWRKPNCQEKENQVTDRSGQVWEELVELMGDIEQDWGREARAMPTADERAEARMFALNCLQHALEFWSQADPARPWFYRWFSPTKKLLGDNPDAIYYGTVIDPRARLCDQGKPGWRGLYILHRRGRDGRWGHVKSTGGHPQ